MITKYKIGNAIDHHKISKMNSIIRLGGVSFESKYKIIAHSDGDIILHAISNAILNAIGVDDIGTYFDDRDQNNKNIDSLKILNFSLNEMNKYKFKINNISIILESDFIFLKPIKLDILQNLKNILNIDDISIHGTRTEQNLEIVSVYATILITSL